MEKIGRKKFELNDICISWSFIATFCLFGISFYIMNCLTPLIADDYGYLLFHRATDILRHGWALYHNWTGRIPAHLMYMMNLSMGKRFFNVVNTVVYLFFIGLCSFHASFGTRRSEMKEILCFLFVNILFFLYTDNWGQVFLWIGGASNYLWTCTIILLFLIPYRIFWSKGVVCYKRWILPVMFLGGVFAGWCNENTSIGVIIFASSIIINALFRKIKVPLWAYSGLLGSILGFTIMIVAPGNAVRMAGAINEDGRPWYYHLIESFQELITYIYNTYRYILFAIIVVATLLVFLHYYVKLNWNVIEGMFLYLINSFVIAFAMIASPEKPGRAFLGWVAFLIISLCYGIMVCIDIFSKLGVLVIIYLNILMFISGVSVCNAFIDLAFYKANSDKRNQYAINCIDEGYKNLVLNQIEPVPRTKYNGAWGLRDFMNDPKEWPNNSYASYYGVDTVTAVSTELFERVFKYGDMQLINCRDIYEYLKLIDNPDYLVLMAVNDESSQSVDDQIVESMKELGLSVDLREHYRWGYLSIIDRGKVVDEKYNNSVLNYYDIIDGHTIEVESSGKIYNKGNRASIKIDGYEYARNSIGLNIVVFNYVKGRVVDSVVFNTWRGLEAMR